MKNRAIKRHGKRMKIVATMLLFVFTYQLINPAMTLALTTGPSQPEVQGFEPVGTTDMVDMFSGDFSYNIPLLDVEGYPVNISYHAGITMEQEASWVGLGWNINPGVINRTVRGVPDDFNGDSLFKDFNMKPEKTLRVGVGAGGEIAGDGDPSTLGLSLSLGANLNISNYKGVSADFTFGCGINILNCASAGINTGVGSQTGASIDYNASLSLSKASSQLMGKDMSGGLGLNAGIGGGYSTRSGIKDINLSFSVTPPNSAMNFSSGLNIPIGVKNYVPVITNSSTMHSISGRIKLGGELLGGFGYVNASATFSKLTFNDDASRSSYGYLYLQHANIDNSSILDFTRDKDGMFNKSMQYLPVPNMTYDIYSLSGQGTGGMFRPFRNDFGNVYDAFTTSKSSSESGEAEGGIGDVFETGLDYTHSNTDITSGPWLSYQRSGTLSKGFVSDSNGCLLEHVYFKEGGELTSVEPAYFDMLKQTSPITPDVVMGFPNIKPGSRIQRDPRANLIYYHTAQEDTASGVSTSPDIISCTDANFTGYANPSKQAIKRIGSGNFQRKKDQISEIVQVQKDGKKYVYGIPAMNNVQKEVTFTVDKNDPISPNSVDLGNGTVSFSGSDATSGNRKGRDNYFSSTVTPSYAHSYLLTSVFSPDYVDVTGNGPSDDDLGSFTKFNYARTDSDFRWVAPYSSNINLAQYNPGFWSDPLDDKGSFVCGSREQWYLHSIETKNFIAEFYTSSRRDAKGIIGQLLNSGGSISTSSIFNGTKGSPSVSYKLDSIKLYNKHDRFINTTNAIPVKTIIFSYNYSLCTNTPNSDPGHGKLTLSKIFFRYGNSQKSMISPYQFAYNASNPAYDLSAKDRWGNYKPNNTAFTNYEFPYVNQNDALNNTYASSWLLDTVFLPSGGIIKVNYESKDYAFVQDKPANEMFMLQGLGNSPDFVGANSLYRDNNAPFLYAYFLRRPGSELSTLSFAKNYMGVNYQPNGQNCMYFNFNVRLTGADNTYEQIKGYANVTDIGICSNDTLYGYIKFKPVTPTGGGANLNPVTYTALNVGRYNLPQIVFPGSDPEESGLHNILSGLKSAFKELLKSGQNPLLELIKKSGGQIVNIDKSYFRLQSVGLCKKGGGQRVSSLYFYDQWKQLAGGSDNTAYYGKQYDYTINDPQYGKISSGVASYEPMIGGDENPMRQPAPYIAQSGSTFPPNDPVDLYQETPVGESLFPGAQVGYRLVTVSSVHANVGRSSQGIDKYEFYTAKDFPAQVIATAINTNSTNHYDFFSQSNIMTATQGYSLIFNDMHGKPKKVEHDVYNPASQTQQPISYQVFNYRQKGGKLNNDDVPCLMYSGMTKNLKLGIEEDITLDSRQKNEVTHTSTLNGNFNFFIIPFIIPIPMGIPLSYTWGSEGQNEFQSAVVGKVVQQYGILDNVVSYSEGALSTMQNELYDPYTGQALVTSVNNEFQDREYTTNIPASWVYKGMMPSYNNIGYRDTGTITVGPSHIGTLNIPNTGPLVAGDELAVSYTDASSHQHNTTVRVLGIVPQNYAMDSSTYTVASHIPGMWCFHGSSGFTIFDGPSHRPLSHADSISPIVRRIDSSLLYFPDTCVDASALPFQLSADFDSFMNVYNANFPMPPGSVFYTPANGGPVVAISENPDGSFKMSGYIQGGHPAFIQYFFECPISPVYDTTYIHRLIPIGACPGLSVLPRFPLNTQGWDTGTTLTNVSIKVINSGQTNRLNENVETYTSMDYPVNTGTGVLNNHLTNLVSLKAKTFADSNTMILHDYMANPDTVNPFTIGERGVWRLYTEYNYQANRVYASTTTRNSGLFNASSMFAPPTGLPLACFLSPYNYLAPYFGDINWHRERTITKYSPNGKEIENIDAIGNYSTAVFGYNQELPVAVASNAKQGEVLSDGFEDYNLLQYTGNILNYIYSPLNSYGAGSLGYTAPLYQLLNLTPSGFLNIAPGISHTGMNSLSVPTTGGSATYTVTIPVNLNNYSGMVNNYNIYFPNSTTYPYPFSSANEYLPFELNPGKSYVLSYWVKQASPTPNVLDYPVDTGCGIMINSTKTKLVKKSNIIDGWQQVEASFPVDIAATTAQILLPRGYYVDDIRIYPANANMKSFVYHPFNEKLMATLDENNFATLYEYDQEGNLVRVKKETTKGIMTISESRSGNPKTIFP